MLYYKYVYMYGVEKVKLRADCHSVQFNERTEFYDHFLLKCVQSAICNEIGE